MDTSHSCLDKGPWYCTQEAPFGTDLESDNMTPSQHWCTTKAACWSCSQRIEGNMHLLSTSYHTIHQKTYDISHEGSIHLVFHDLVLDLD